MFELVTPGAGPVLTPEAPYEETWQRSTRRCYIPNIKALRLPFSEKKNFEVSFFVPMLELVIPWAGLVLTLGASSEQLVRGSLGDATYQISKL